MTLSLHARSLLGPDQVMTGEWDELRPLAAEHVQLCRTHNHRLLECLGLYLLAMLVNMVAPTGLSSPRGYFNLDWITLLVIIVIAVLGAIYFLAARPDRGISQHVVDRSEPGAAP